MDAGYHMPKFSALSRRDFITSCAGFSVYALLHEARAFIPPRRELPAARWLSRHDELARGLVSGTLSQGEWHDAVNALANEVNVEDISKTLKRATLRSAGMPFGHDPQKRFITFKNDQGEILRHAYGTALFSFDANSVITPHAHRHMASAHMVLEGKIRVRTFDRIKDEDGALILRPTMDVIAEPGHAAAMTSAKDNVHWFTPKTTHAVTFDVIIDGLDQGQAPYEIQPVDPIRSTALPDGTIRAPLLSFEESAQFYTAGR